MIGLLLLIGIVKKNAILMVDFALEAERAQGMRSSEAIYQACLLRFRPIIMTTMAALFGALPLVISSGMGSELRRPLGIAIAGGLIFSQGAHAPYHSSRLPLLRPSAGMVGESARTNDSPWANHGGLAGRSLAGSTLAQ